MYTSMQSKHAHLNVSLYQFPSCIYFFILNFEETIKNKDLIKEHLKVKTYIIYQSTMYKLYIFLFLSNLVLKVTIET